MGPMYGESFGQRGHVCHSIGGCVLEFMEETPIGRGCFHDARVDSASNSRAGARDIGDGDA